MDATLQRETKSALELRGCLSRSGIFFLVSAALLHLAVWISSPHWVFEKGEPFLLECLDQLAFQAMLWGFAKVLWRPDDCRPWLLLAKAGFCFQMALGTGGQSFDATLPRSAAILFMWVAMWHLLSRLGIGVLGLTSESTEPPP